MITRKDSLCLHCEINARSLVKVEAPPPPTTPHSHFTLHRQLFPSVPPSGHCPLTGGSVRSHGHLKPIVDSLRQDNNLDEGSLKQHLTLSFNVQQALQYAHTYIHSKILCYNRYNRFFTINF